ncbi:hypothetical protein P5673_001114 [Acropora cervicornis]|uniref:Uncharacterized protein n=1 Tax=Acropora cervicornis TaxID=6130 RepID=A0AAD9R5X7_ACRCE|nr:hypothetical protein P5673_001114 [Acropora cervicornis]
MDELLQRRSPPVIPDIPPMGQSCIFSPSKNFQKPNNVGQLDLQIVTHIKKSDWEQIVILSYGYW